MAVRVRNTLRFIKRASIFLLIWSLALIALVRSAGKLVEHQRLSARVATLEQEYEQQVQEYTAVLAEGERIVSDDEKQSHLLKEKLGYAKPDETPIIILRRPE